MSSSRGGHDAAGVERGVGSGRLAKGPAAATIAAQITAMAQTFIAGADLQEALPRLRRLWDQGQA
jgi:hypothetical protein